MRNRYISLKNKKKIEIKILKFSTSNGKEEEEKKIITEFGLLYILVRIYYLVTGGNLLYKRLVYL